MSKGKFVAYYRVSTAKQGRSGLGLEAQRKAVMDYLNGGRWELIAEFTEVESGKVDARPELAKARALCELTGATLVIAKLDRLSRDVEFLAGMMKSKTKFVAADLPEANNLTIHIMAAVAQAEREMISARTKAALAAAKARGVKLGGRRGNGDDLRRGPAASAAVRSAAAKERAANVRAYIDALRAEGATSLRDLAAGLNARGIPTARGALWTAAAVRRVLASA